MEKVILWNVQISRVSTNNFRKIKKDEIEILPQSK